MISKYRDLYISYCTNFEIQNLIHSDIWYEYYDPSELEDLVESGFDYNWLIKKLIDENPLLETHSLYAWQPKKLLKTEFTYIGCNVKITDQIFLSGFVFKIINAINALTIVYENEFYEFYNHEVFGEENCETLKRLLKNLPIKTKLIPISSLELTFNDEIKSFFNLDSNFTLFQHKPNSM